MVGVLAQFCVSVTSHHPIFLLTEAARVSERTYIEVEATLSTTENSRAAKRR
jgi:hypothetical protein